LAVFFTFFNNGHGYRFANDNLACKGFVQTNDIDKRNPIALGLLLQSLAGCKKTSPCTGYDKKHLLIAADIAIELTIDHQKIDVIDLLQFANRVQSSDAPVLFVVDRRDN